MSYFLLSVLTLPSSPPLGNRTTGPDYSVRLLTPRGSEASLARAQTASNRLLGVGRWRRSRTYALYAPRYAPRYALRYAPRRRHAPNRRNLTGAVLLKLVHALSGAGVSLTSTASNES